jgi:hypothetical protein
MFKGAKGTFAIDLRFGGTRAGSPDLLRRNGKSGTRAMSKEREYRAYAGACIDLANKTTNEHDKKRLLAIAEAWLGLIDRVQQPVREPDVDLLHPALRAKLGGPCH